MPELSGTGVVIKRECDACGGTEHVRQSYWHGEQYICVPCFLVWYDPPGPAFHIIDQTDPKAIGVLSNKLKAAGRWPWTGRYKPEDEE